MSPWDIGSWGQALLFALVIVVIAPIGDLTESMFKRNLDVKDFGHAPPRPRRHPRPLRRAALRPAGRLLRLIIEPWV